MEIKYKLYPYPVLSSYSNDYGTGAFDVAIDIVRDGYDLRIDFLATLTCQSLQDCIKQGVAKFVYHLECSQTGFRTVVQTDKVSEVYTLLNKAVNGKLQICPFVVAVDDLKLQTENIMEVEPGEYTRVCHLIEKHIYGEILLSPYEERTLNHFLEKLMEPVPGCSWKMRLKLRYACLRRVNTKKKKRKHSAFQQK